METKSTNEVKGDYDRVSASECLGSLIELHGIVMEDDLFVIPDADGTAVLYNDGKIRFDEWNRFLRSAGDRAEGFQDTRR